MPDTPKFERATRAQAASRTDLEGKVNVVIQLVDKGAAIRGNISRSFTVQKGKVSDVADILEKALFGEQP